MVSTCHLFANPATTANKKHPTPHKVILQLDAVGTVSVFDFFFAFAILENADFRKLKLLKDFKDETQCLFLFVTLRHLF